MKSQKRAPYFLILALLVAGYFSYSPAAKAADTSSGSPPEITQLLSQVKTEAIALDEDAEYLATMTRNRQARWEAHAERLSLMRDHINKAGELLTKLNEARETASPWQHQAIDRIYPLLKELADNTEATINHLNDNRKSIHFPPYIDYAKAGADLAKELATLVRDYVAYGDNEAEFHRLQEKLVPAAK